MAPGPSSDPHRARPLQPSPTISGSGSFTKFINASYKSECLELYEMMDEYCRIGRRHITSSKNQGIKDLPVNICEYAFSYIYETVQTHPEDLADNVFHCWSKITSVNNFSLIWTHMSIISKSPDSIREDLNPDAANRHSPHSGLACGPTIEPAAQAPTGKAATLLEQVHFDPP
uniref:Uncharacterized protein n=1 Tax=Oryza sativa subsp. japonica TaxID=39947 RepID=Q2R2U2_ORYSJ|nr:hypothetical protein LOC_Os11g34650 [Oryza sativa Japonica Group]